MPLESRFCKDCEHQYGAIFKWLPPGANFCRLNNYLSPDNLRCVYPEGEGEGFQLRETQKVIEKMGALNRRRHARR